MITICFPKKETPGLNWIGGLGDRIVGLVSVKLIANLLNIPFYIKWDKENIKEYFDYDKYDFDNISTISNDIKYINLMGYQYTAKQLFLNCDDTHNLFTNDINVIYTNVEISQYLYKHPHFKHCNYYRDIFDTYKSLYTEILKPTNILIERVNNLIHDVKLLVGIQLRCGADAKLSNNKTKSEIDRHNGCYGHPWTHISQEYPLHDEIENIFKNIKSKCDSDINDGYKIFITSDYSFYNDNDIYDIASNIWDQSQIIFNNDPAQHLDRNLNGDFSKVFVDNYILSQHCNTLFISTSSNYGRIAALSNPCDDIYDLFLNKLDKRNLLSKHESY